MPPPSESSAKSVQRRYMMVRLDGEMLAKRPRFFGGAGCGFCDLGEILVMELGEDGSESSSSLSSSS